MEMTLHLEHELPDQISLPTLSDEAQPFCAADLANAVHKVGQVSPQFLPPPGAVPAAAYGRRRPLSWRDKPCRTP